MKSSKSTTPSMNHSSEASHIDHYDEENTNTSSSTVDFSLLRKPIVTSVTGFSEAKKAYDSGTEEIRKLLANECDLIYECKVCRNIFRSLVNFISHKRVYCQTTFSSNHHFHFSSNGYIDQDISTIIQAENEFISNQRGKSSRDTENKDLSAIVERLIKKQKSKRESKLSDFYEQIEQKFVSQQHHPEMNGGAVTASSNGIAHDNIILQLNSVPESSAAVYQTLKVRDGDNIRDEVNEVHEMLENNNVVLDPNGKAISVSPVNMAIAGPSKQPEIACEMCDERFTTEKTLKIHIEKKHIPSTVVHQCPSCPETFLQPAAVLRHLSNVHKKSQKRLRQARDKCMRGTRSDEVTKPHTKEVPPIKIVRKDDDIRVWTGDFSSDNTPTCPYCNKKFERKAVLTAHVQTCGTHRETKPRKRTTTPKIIPAAVVPKLEIESGDENSNHSCETNVSVVAEKKATQSETNTSGKSSVNKRKRKGPLVIRNESPEIKDEAEVFWNVENRNSEPILETIQIKKELDTTTDDPELTIEEPTTKKRKMKKEKDADAPEVIKNIPCALCSKKFSTNTNLKRHVAMFHFRQNRFACKKCDFRGYRRIDTLTHLNNIHKIQGEKEELNQYIEISVKEEDLRGPINTAEKCDPNLTFSSVVASIDLSESVPGSSKSNPRSRKVSSKEVVKEKSSLVETKDSSFSFTPVKNKEESGSSGMSSPTSDKISDSDARRPTRNRIKPVRKDFVYDLNKIIKQEADVHRENQQQQQLLYPSRNRGRKSVTPSDTPITFLTPTKEKTDATPELDKENLDESKSSSSIQISEIYGAALKMAKIEVMNQRACFHKPPEIPAERPFVPAKISTPRRSDGKIIKDVPALLKTATSTTKKGRKRNEIKRVPSFTDQFLSNTGSDKKFKAREEGNKSEPIAIFPKATSAPPSLRALKASKKLDLSSVERGQLEMLQQLRSENGNDFTNANNASRVSVFQRLAENKRKSQEFPQKPNIED